MKILSMILAFTLVLSGCGSSEGTVETEKTVADMKIGILQGAEHPALDDARDGFIEALVANGFLEENIDAQNAQGDNANFGPIATKFVNDDVDLILAIGTQAAQTAAQATKEIPILVTAVTDPESAGVVETNEVPGRNVSGTSDMNPIKEQIEMLLQFVPEAKSIGIMYCSSEPNSTLQAEIAQGIIEELGLSFEIYTASESNEIQSLVQSTVDKVDAIYIPTDNLFASAMGTVALVAIPNQIPVICGESGMVNTGGLATYALSYKALGAQTGEQAVDILLEGADISTMPIAYSPVEDLSVTVNVEMAKEIGIEIPEELK